MTKKHPQLAIFIESLLEKNIFLSAIVIQEARISDDTDCSLYELPKYNLEPQGKICSEKGGLLTYIHESYTYTKRKELYSKSNIYEALYLRISGPALKKNITLCNIYRPPRLNN